MPKTSNCEPKRVLRWMPAEGCDTPESGEGEQIPRTLKSLRRSFERREAENTLCDPAHIFLALVQLGRGLTVAEKQQIHFKRGVAVSLDFEAAPERGRF